MPNDITIASLTEIVYAARDQVAREATGFIQGCTINSTAEGVSTGGTISSIRTTTPTLNNSYTPAMSVPASADISTSVESMTLSQTANVQIPLKGETVRQITNTAGRGAFQNLIAQGIRAMVNAIEARIGVVAKNGASRAIGTAGTTPFASNPNTIAQLRQILRDNGCPCDDGMLNLVINTAAGTNLRNLANLYKVNEAGTDATLRRGELLNIHNFSIRESAGVAAHTKGTGTSYQTNGVVSIGDTTINIDTGTGTLLAGDIITATGGNHSYVARSALSGGAFGINFPGAREAIADNTALAIGNNYTANIGFHKSAIELAMRPIAMPEGGDAGQHEIIFDDVTGLVFDLGLYQGRGMNMLEMTCVYEAKVWKPEFVATLLG